MGPAVCNHKRRPVVAYSFFFAFLLFLLSSSLSGKAPIDYKSTESNLQTEDIVELWVRGDQKGAKNTRNGIDGLIQGLQPKFLIESAKVWKPGSTLRVCFLVDHQDWNGRVATYAQEWTAIANIMFDFGTSSEGLTYRLCPSESRDFHIRIGYDCPGVDWALVGRESENPTLAAPCGDARKSMTLGTMTKTGATDAEIRRAVLHEFGHVLGFLHEFQHPDSGCDQEIKWDLLVPILRNARPDLNESSIRANFLQKTRGSAYELSVSVDKQSIMQYFIPAKLLKAGDKSPCYSQKNFDISESDRKGAQSFYPPSPEGLLE